MFAYVVVALFVFTAVLVGLSLADSALRARSAFQRLKFERRQSDISCSDVVVTVVRPAIQPQSTVVVLPAREPAAAIRALRPLAAAA